MEREIIKQKIYDALEAASFSDPDYFIDVFDDGDEHIRVLIISRKFDIHHHKTSERDDLIWNHIVKVLSEEETQRVSRIVAVNPEEIKVYT